MPVKVKLPAAIARYTNDQTEVEARGSTVQEVIAHLEDTYAGLGKKFLNESGKPLRFVRIYVNRVDIRKLNGLDTTVSDGDEIALVPAFVGG